MAINPETQYPGKIAPGDAEYPYGKARNITVPGDGTGTPWEAALVNDLFGFQQALLDEAGIVPTGNSDHVGASQYLDAINALFIRTGALVVDVSGGVTFTLSTEQSAVGVLVFTGEITADIAVTVPEAPRRWLVLNSTTGAFSLTFRTVSGTGFVLFKGEYYGARSDGTNVIKTAGTAASRDTGDQTGNMVQLEDVEGAPGLPSVDGSQLLNLPGGGSSVVPGEISGLEIRTSQSRGEAVIEIAKGYATDRAGLLDIQLSGGSFVDASVSGERGIYQGNRDADTWYAVYLLKKTDDSVTVMAVHQDTPVWAFSGTYSGVRLIAWARLDSAGTPAWRPITSYENGTHLITVPEETGSSGVRLVSSSDPADTSWNRVALYKFIAPGSSNFFVGQVAQQRTKGARAAIRIRPMGSQRVQLDTSYLFINSGPESGISNAQAVDVVIANSREVGLSVIEGVRTLEWSSRYGNEASGVFIDIVNYASNRKPPSDWNQFKRDDYPFRPAQFVRMFQEAGTFYMYGFKFTGTGSAIFDDIYLWTSTDGVTWTEIGVILSPGAGGSWDDSRVWSLNVVKVAAGDYRALYTGRDSAGGNQIGYANASAPDGPWTKFASNPVISPVEVWEGNDVEVGSILVDGATIYSWYHQTSGSPRQTGLATSSDWETWTKDAANPIFEGSTTAEFTESQQFSPGIFKYNGVFYNVISSYNGSTKDSTDGFMVLYRDSAATFYADERERIGVIATVSQKWEEGGSQGVFDTFRVVVDGDSPGDTVPYVSLDRLWAPYSAYDGSVDNGRWACGMMNIPKEVFD